MLIIYVVFGIGLVLVACMLALVLSYRRLVRNGRGSPEATALYLKRFAVLRRAVKWYPWLLIAFFVLLGILGSQQESQ